MRQNGPTAAKSRHSRPAARTHGHAGESAAAAALGRSSPAVSTEPACLAVFLTDLGWFGLVGHGETVLALTIGHASADAVRAALARFSCPAPVQGRPHEVRPAPGTSTGRALNDPEPGSDAAPGSCRLEPGDWNPDLRRRLEAFARGQRCDFLDCQLDLPAVTAFQRRVIAETRRVGWGQTLTYGELADRAGAPRAARAVGSVMAANRVPIIVPCHRVIASGGRLGGYSAPQGLDLKRRLLRMEAAGG